MVRWLLILCIFVCPLTAAAVDWQMDKFMIFGGWPWVKGVDPELQVKLLSDAGFTIIMGDRDKLELCKKYGIKLIVENITPEEVPKISKHPALWGYWIIDEPLWNFHAVRKVADDFHRADPKHPVYVNLVSRAGNYLQKYMDIVKPEILSYDYYEWWWGTEGHFSKLEKYREAALAADVPLIRWVEFTATYGYEFEGHDKSRPSDNEARLRRTVFTSLAYGVKGIEWFTARALFEPDGASLNDCGKDVAAINADLKMLGPILMKLKSIDVFHTAPLPRDTREVPEKHWVQMAESGYPNLVMGLFQDEDKNDYLLMANSNWMCEKLAVLEFREPVETVEKFNKRTGEWVPLTIRKEGVTEEARKLITRNLAFQMYSQRTGGDLVEHGSDNYDRWFTGKMKNLFVECMLAPGDGDLLRVKRDLSPETTRNW
jgi:hypothetical protein